MRLESGRLGDRDDGGSAVDGRTGGVDDTCAVELGGDLEEVDRRGNVVLIVGQGDFSGLADGLVGLCTRSYLSIWRADVQGVKEAYRDVNNTPDATLAVLLEDFADLVALGEVDGEGVDLCAVLVLF